MSKHKHGKRGHYRLAQAEIGHVPSPVLKAVEIYGIPARLTEQSIRETLSSIARFESMSISTDPATYKRIAFLSGVASKLSSHELETNYRKAFGLPNDNSLLIEIGHENRSGSVHATSIPIGGQPNDKLAPRS